jgi:hypothetical protein
MMSRLGRPSLLVFGPVNLSNICTEPEPGRTARFDWSAVEKPTPSTELTVGFFFAVSAVVSLSLEGHRR